MQQQPSETSATTAPRPPNAAPAPVAAATGAAVLFGLESSGKSALFRGLTGDATGDESNYRGSTVFCRSAPARDRRPFSIVDTPGLQSEGDSETTRLAMTALDDADVVALVVRATDASGDLAVLRRALKDHPRADAARALLIVTFEDRAPAGLETWLANVSESTGLPGVSVCARDMPTAASERVLDAIARAGSLAGLGPAQLPDLPSERPRKTLLERRHLGAALALLLFAALFAAPVYAAYILADWLQPGLDANVLDPLRAMLADLAHSAPLLHSVLVGDYGLITLGAYSFLWAFPVVLFIGAAMALTDETGLRDRMATALDPLMRTVGLSGRDLLPVLSGFGCNVVAVMQTRGCSRERRGACVSLISFGSSCSYQLGAGLSVFSAAGHPGLFAPFVLVVFVAGLAHTRLWHGGRKRLSLPLVQTTTWLQPPTWRGLWWRVRAVCKQFLLQAMPIFLAICAASALLAHVGLMDTLASAVASVLDPLFGLPADAAPAVVLSVLRKDGILLLNQGEGALATSLGAGALFLAVYLAATLSPCLVTLFTTGRELGARTAAKVAGRQLVTALASALVVAFVIRLA